MPRTSKPNRPAYIPKRKQPGNRGVNAKLYNSTRWRKYTKAYRIEQTILREGYGCEVAYHADEMESANVTDHIIPISAGGAVWDKRNHMAMSHYYHNVKRGYEKCGLGLQVMKGKDGLIPIDRMHIINKLLKRDAKQ